MNHPQHVALCLRRMQECCKNRDLCELQRIHALVVENDGLGSLQMENFDQYLIHIYGKCHSPDDSRWLFDNISQRNVVTWNMMLSAYSQNGRLTQVIWLFQEMRRQDVEPSTVTFVTTLKSCTQLHEGQYLHTLIHKSGFESDVTVCNALIHMFARCGNIDLAFRTFLRMSQRDFITWTTLIDALIQDGRSMEALHCFKYMLSDDDLHPSAMTYATILNACSSLETLEEGKCIYDRIIKIGYDSFEFVVSSLLTMYGKCGLVNDAEWLFDNNSRVDTITWNSMISVYVRHGHCDEALQLFEEMLQQCIKPNSVTVITLLDACTELLAFKEGKLIHNCVLDMGIDSNAACNSLLNFYGHCGSPPDAFNVFDKMTHKDVVSWSTMVQVFASSGCHDQIFKTLKRMHECGIKPNKVTFVNVLKAFMNSGKAKGSMIIHSVAACEKLELDIVICNILITMYGNYGSPIDACKVFTSMSRWDAVSWTAVIAAHTQSGYGREAFGFFLQMLEAGVAPTDITFVSIFDVLTAVEEGNVLYFLTAHNGIESDTLVGNACINFYAKCGKLDDAFHVFENLQDKDIISWSTIVASYAHQGEGWDAFNLVMKMGSLGIKPDDITFVSVLSACSHAGLTSEGIQFFYMLHEYGISPSEEHYRCMVDMLSRAGLLGEVEAFIDNLPLHPTIVEWMTLLAACRVHADAEKAERIAEYVVELDSENPAGYVILSNICIAAGKQGEGDRVRKEMLDNVRGEAISGMFIEEEEIVHDFV